MRLRSQVIPRSSLHIDPQYQIGVPDLHDLDRPQGPIMGLHTSPGDRFYIPNPSIHSDMESRESSTEPMDTDEAQQITNRLAQRIRDNRGLQ